MSKAEFNKWVSYYLYKEPEETELQLAHLSAIVSGALGNKKAKIEDFLINGNSRDKSKDIGPNGVMTDSAILGAFGGATVKQMK